MKYLMLFEAFESGVISKISKFVKKKVGRKSLNGFLDDLRNIKDRIDFPIDKISDNDVEYLSAKNAIKIDKSDRKEFDDYKNIYCLKFWFSLERGYIGFSGVGDYVAEKIGGGFTKDEIDYIKNTLDIKTGILKIVNQPNDFSKLKTGDKVVAEIRGSGRYRIVSGTMFMDGDRMYFIGNDRNCAGSYPEYESGTREELGNWRDFGQYSWSLGRPNNLGDDWRKLHKYIEGENELDLYDDGDEKMLNYTFNLPIDIRNGRVTIRNWSSAKEDDWSFRRFITNEYKYGWEKIEEADFCIVLYLDNLKVDDDKRPSQLKSKRLESKKDALALMSNEQIMKANLERYLSAMLSRMGIDKTSLDIKNLQKMISMFICGDYSLFTIYGSRPSLSNIREISNTLIRLIDYYNRSIDESYSESDREYYRAHMVEYYNNTLSKYKSYSNDGNTYKKVYDSNYKSLFYVIDSIENDENVKSSVKQAKEFFEKFKEIGSYINSKILNSDIKTMEDMFILENKLRSIKSLFDNELFSFKSDFRYILGDFKYTMSSGDFKHYIMSSKSNIDSDIKKINKIEEYVKSILG